MSPPISITFIGAGSITFTRQLLRDILSFPELAGVRIALHDIDPERLSVAEALARRTADQLGAKPEIVAEIDRRAALEGSDVVVNMVAVGGHRATVTDFEVPARFGLRQTIGDTLGIGGIFRALRTFPLLDALAADMAAVCPDAWLLNYTNPMAMNLQYLASVAPGLKAAGLCHSVYWTVRGLCDIVGVPHEEVDVLSAGVSHQAWILRWRHQGRDLYPALDEAIERDPELRRRVRVDMNVVELVVAAAVEGDPRHIRHAAMSDPATAAALTVDEIWALCDAMVAAHGDALPPALRASLGTR
jgi:alpha-galactosidase